MKMDMLRERFRPITALLAGLWLISVTPFGQATPAPGAPGASSVWASADKSFLGTSASPTSRVYFTGSRGIVTEVFYPTLDRVQSVDLQFLVGDAANTWVDEEKLQDYSVTRPDPRSLVWQVVDSKPAHDWRITKRVFTDPARNALIERVTFEALNGKNVSQFNLYLLHNPAMNDSGANDVAKTVAGQGRTWLVASEGANASALGISLPWKNGKASNGFVGTSDGWTDLLGGSADKRMDWNYELASTGNVAQLGWVDFGASTAASIQFDVVLAFGTTETDAINVAAAALSANPAATETAYGNEWLTYTGALNDQGGLADDEYYLAAMVLKSSQDKSNGAMVAGMGTPWGETNGDGNSHGYHLVWSRDLFKFANALVNAGDTNTANQAVDFLFNVQMDPNTGRFPQNSWINGQALWNATQMDEQAMPIILAWRLNRTDLWPKIQKTADYIMSNGPRTDQERWEENAGYSPSTIAAEIAGLVCAAEIAQANGDMVKAGAYRAKADDWRSQLDNWTFTTTGPYGNGRYYIRISGDTDPNSGSITLGNGGGTHDERAIVDGGFLELVRMGIKAPDDAAILDSLPEYDAVLKQSIAGKGNAWFRYNCDGYGEHNDGSNYNGSGRGRLWPIFTAERGMYEIHRANDGNVGKPYLNMLKAFAGDTGMISEQVWNNTANVGGCDAVTPSPYVPGTATKSIRPLNWAMGEYINLLASVNANKIVDVPEAVCQRYGTCVPHVTATCPNNQTVYIDPSKAVAGQPVEICYADPKLASGSALQLHWGVDAWHAVTDTPMARKADGAWWATVTPACNATKLDYVFTNGMGAWDNNAGMDWHQNLDAAPVGTCSLVTVNFQVDNAHTLWGQNIYVVGDAPQLGGWNTNQGVKMTPCSYPSWCAGIQLPANAPIQFKFVRRDPVAWETGDNRTLSTPASGTDSYQGGSFRY
jgi:glucoamylase